MAIIHLGQPLPAGSSDLPGGRIPINRNSGGQPFWRLPIWSCTARSLPGRACHHTRRCALTLSLKTGRTVSPITPINRGWSVLCCTCRRPTATRFGLLCAPGWPVERPAVSGLAAL